MDFQNRAGGKTGTGGQASWSDMNKDRRERLRQLALETIDLAKDPYFMKNHLGSYECKLCLTLHNNEGSYLAHTQVKKTCIEVDIYKKCRVKSIRRIWQEEQQRKRKKWAARRSLQLAQMFLSRSSSRSEDLDTKSQSKDVHILASKAFFSRSGFKHYRFEWHLHPRQL